MFWFFDNLDTGELASLARSSGYVRLDISTLEITSGEPGVATQPMLHLDPAESGGPYSTIVLVNGQEESERQRSPVPGLPAWATSLCDALVADLSPSGTIFVVDLPPRLPYFGLDIGRRGFAFKYWYAVEWPADERSSPASPACGAADAHTAGGALPTVHLGILHYVRDKKRFHIQKVRTQHQYCRFCGEPLADWGGKKANRNPAGRVISDVWLQMATWATRAEWQREILRRLFSLAVVPGTPVLVVLVKELAREEAVTVSARSRRAPAADHRLGREQALPQALSLRPGPGLGLDPGPQPEPQPTPRIAPRHEPTLRDELTPRAETAPRDGLTLRDDPAPRDELTLRDDPAPRDELTLRDELLQGDILEVISRVPSESVDLAFADPPYNLNKNYGRYDDDRHDEEYLSWCNRWLAEYARILKPGGCLFVLNLPRWAVRHAVFLDQYDGLCRQNWIVWDALSEPRGRVMPAHYSILFYTKGPRPAHFHPERAEVEARGGCFRARCLDQRRRPAPSVRLTEGWPGGGGDARLAAEGRLVADGWPVADGRPVADGWPVADGRLDDIWHDVHRIRHRRDRDAHPCQLPLRLVERIVTIASEPGDLVFDGFMGTGSTALAARKLGRHYLGIEIDPAYIEIARAKLDGFDTTNAGGRLRPLTGYQTVR